MSTHAKAHPTAPGKRCKDFIDFFLAFEDDEEEEEADDDDDEDAPGTSTRKRRVTYHRSTVHY